VPECVAPVPFPARGRRRGPFRVSRPSGTIARVVSQPGARVLADLRVASLRCDAYPGGTSALEFHVGQLERFLPAAVVRVCGPIAEPEAFTLRWRDPDPPTTLPVVHLLVHRRPPGDASAAWAAEVLPAEALAAGPDF